MLRTIGLGLFFFLVSGCHRAPPSCVVGAVFECPCAIGAVGTRSCTRDGMGACQCPAGFQAVETVARAEPRSPLSSSELRRRRASYEAQEEVRRIYERAVAAWWDSRLLAAHGIGPKSGFPGPSAGPTPPLDSCCKNADGKCKPDPTLWRSGAWSDLGFSIKRPSSYSYEYIVRDDPPGFTVRAVGDLECNGVYSTIELVGELDDGALSMRPAKLVAMNDSQ